jgi:predicted dehydrogenase
MKQVLQDFKTGECTVAEVPAPVIREGFVVVRNHYSLISTGTEGGTVKLGQMSLLGKARARPEQVKKVLQVAKTQGVVTAYQAARRALEMPVALGYCAAGEVIEIGAGVTGFEIGAKVACGGAGFANHAEVVIVPKNLAVPIPDDVTMRQACFTTLGSIALQSVRIADTRLGESVVVIGLGLVGLFTVQLLRAGGCRVFGIDIDKQRVAFACGQGYCRGAALDASNLKELVEAFSGGNGADAVIITAATEDNGPVALAGELARRKARIVCVGRTEMKAPRETYLFKELELCTSMAYGPGTGDPTYELDGIDYPLAYVRWTEGRNMRAVLDQIAQGRVDTEALVTHEFVIDEAPAAFDLITGATKERSTGVLLAYPLPSAPAETVRTITLQPARSPTRVEGEIGVSVIGAGSYATNEFLPLLAKKSDVRLRGIVSATGVRAKALGEKYGFETCASEADGVIADDQTDCVFILTRHDTHASLAAAALERGKHVFVEKPLALNHQELERVIEAQQRSGGRHVMVGFNRRYAPLALRMKDFVGQRAQPAFLIYRANVGYRPPEHWLHDPVQGGGVILGEACHHIDFCNWLLGGVPTRVEARALAGTGAGMIPEDNVQISLSYADGSIAVVAYLSNGCKAYDNERVEIFCDNKTAALTDYKKLEMASGLSVAGSRRWITSDKGHGAQIDALLEAIRGDGVIDSASYFDSSRIAIDAAAAVFGGTGA